MPWVSIQVQDDGDHIKAVSCSFLQHFDLAGGAFNQSDRRCDRCGRRLSWSAIESSRIESSRRPQLATFLVAHLFYELSTRLGSAWLCVCGRRECSLRRAARLRSSAQFDPRVVWMGVDDSRCARAFAFADRQTTCRLNARADAPKLAAKRASVRARARSTKRVTAISRASGRLVSTRVESRRGSSQNC